VHVEPDRSRTGENAESSVLKNGGKKENKTLLALIRKRDTLLYGKREENRER